MNKKLVMTNWFDIKVAPIRQGFYEIRYVFNSKKIYIGYWNGKNFSEVHLRNRHGKHTELVIPVDWIQSWRGVCK